MTARATRIGFFTSRIASTAPIRPSEVMSAASISTVFPSMQIREPVPALYRGSSSRRTAAAITASRASFPAASRRSPSSAARSGPSFRSSLAPTPPWVTM